MKVTVCPKCGITPDITKTELKCPKCGRTAIGKDLNDTVTKWNNGEIAENREPKPVVKEEEIVREEPVKKEIRKDENEMPPRKPRVRRNINNG